MTDTDKQPLDDAEVQTGAESETAPDLGSGTFAEALADAAEPKHERNLALILDVPVTLSMELGRTRMSIRDLLQLSQGSVVKLDRPAGEPLDVLVNGCLIARGEVVVVNERFGLRITQIVSPEQRVKKLA